MEVCFDNKKERYICGITFQIICGVELTLLAG